MIDTKASTAKSPDQPDVDFQHLWPDEKVVEPLNWEELEEDLRCGDNEAITYVVNTLYPSLFTLAERLLVDRSAADDVVNAALLCALDKIRQEHPVYDWDGFILAQVYYKARDQNKKTRRQRRHEGPSLNQSSQDDETTSWANEIEEKRSATPLDVVLQREQAELLRILFTGLPRELQEVINLRCLEGLKLREAAELLGIPLATVYGRVRRAIAILRGRMESAFD